MEGFIRKIDKLGRICLPMEFRRREKLSTNDQVEMIVTDDGLLMRKYEGADKLAAAVARLKDAIRDDNRIDSQEKATVLVQVASLERVILGKTEEGEGNDA